MIGIYKITNTIDNRCYIGKSIDLKRRIRKHKAYLKSESHHNIHLQRAYNKYGLENFRFEIIEKCDEDNLDYLEMFYIQKYDAFEYGYNMNLGGENGRGYKHSQEFKNRQRLNNMGGNNPSSRKVVCENRVFNTIRECAYFYNVNEKTMQKWLSGYRKMRQDFVDKGLAYL